MKKHIISLSIAALLIASPTKTLKLENTQKSTRIIEERVNGFTFKVDIQSDDVLGEKEQTHVTDTGAEAEPEADQEAKDEKEEDANQSL